MTALPADPVTAQRWRPRVHDWRRVPFALLLLALLAAPGALGEVTRAALVDAYLGVSVFVAATLLLFYGIERLFRVDTTALLARHRVWQVPVAALLGALPGCGGAIIVMAAFARGRLGFGAVMATLTATMGDAAFLLIATRPDAALLLIPVAIAVGTLSGWIADALVPNACCIRDRQRHSVPPAIGRVRLRDLVFLALSLPGLLFGVVALLQVDPVVWFSPVVIDLALAGIAVALLLWMLSPVGTCTHPEDPAVTRASEETAFVTVWVVAAFLLYEYAEAFLGIDPASLASAAAPLVPLIAILVGFIPGCGPQLVVTTLYINGAIPFAALVGNAISNDGDALFPALAVSRRAAILATLASAIPALLVAYGFLLADIHP